jgi:hypothetical protein
VTNKELPSLSQSIRDAVRIIRSRAAFENPLIDPRSESVAAWHQLNLTQTCTTSPCTWAYQYSLITGPRLGAVHSGGVHAIPWEP